MSNWNEQRIETMKSMWAEGFSAGQIARRLGNISRNAVIGKIHRMKLMTRSGGPRTPRPPQSLGLAPERPLLELLEEKHDFVAPAESQPIDINPDGHPEPLRLESGALIGTFDLTRRHCHWPHGDPRSSEFHYCGHAPRAGSSYCEPHSKRAWQPKKAESADVSAV